MVQHRHVEIQLGYLDGILGHHADEVLPLVHDTGLVLHGGEHDLLEEGAEDLHNLLLVGGMLESIHLI